MPRLCRASQAKSGAVWIFHHVAGRVNGSRQQRVVIGVDGCQAPAGEHGGDRGLSGAGKPAIAQRSSVSIVGQP